MFNLKKLLRKKQLNKIFNLKLAFTKIPKNLNELIESNNLKKQNIGIDAVIDAGIFLNLNIIVILNKNNCFNSRIFLSKIL